MHAGVGGGGGGSQCRLHPYREASFLGIGPRVAAPGLCHCLKNENSQCACLENPIGSDLKLLEIWWHRLVLVSFARLALAPYPIVLADAPPSALLARAPYPSVLADARPSALLALAPYPSVLADARPSALLARAPYPSVLADASPSVLLAPAPSPIVLALPRLPG